MMSSPPDYSFIKNLLLRIASIELTSMKRKNFLLVSFFSDGDDFFCSVLQQ